MCTPSKTYYQHITLQDSVSSSVSTSPTSEIRMTTLSVLLLVGN